MQNRPRQTTTRHCSEYEYYLVQRVSPDKRLSTARQLNRTDLQQVDPVTDAPIGHARQRDDYLLRIDWLQRN